MSCNIINPEQVSINGSNSVYGGYIQSLQFNIGALNGGHRASVTLVSENSISTPSKGDAMNISMMGMDLKMKVGGFSSSSSASSLPSVTLDLYDESNDHLDKSFIVLKEEFPESGSVPDNVKILGRLMGPLPDKELTENSYSILPNKDIKWGDLRKFFSELSTPGSFFGKSSKILTKDEVDYYCANASGKTLWYVDSDTYGGTTLKDAIGTLLEGDDLPNGPFAFSGSYRDVLTQLCSTIGFFAYWDAEKNKVKIVNNINLSAGMSKLQDIQSSCYVISSGQKKDFTVTRSQGAYGSMSSDHPGESYSIFGAKQTRYLRARLLTPEFHYKNCGEDSSDLKELAGDGLGKAMAASSDSNVFAMYALQSVLKGNADLGALPDIDIDIDVKGQGNADTKIKSNIASEFLIDSGAGFEANEFLSNYYLGSGGSGDSDPTASDPACSGGNVFPVKVDNMLKDQFRLKAFMNWNAKKGEPPVSILGFYDFAGSFADGVLFIKPKTNHLASIIDENGSLNSEADILRKYLSAIVKFNRRFYVVPEGSGLRTVKGNNLAYDYGYYMFTDSSRPSYNFNISEGYRMETVYPFQSVSQCNVSEISDLAKICAMMYTDSGCNSDVLDDIPVVEFIRALDRNELKKLFKNPSGYSRSQVSYNPASTNPDIQMFLIIAQDSEIEGFEDSKSVCWAEGIETSSVAQNSIKKLSELIWKPSFGINTFADIDIVDYSLFGVTSHSIGEFIQPVELSTNNLANLKVWYDVQQSNSTIKTNAGNFFIKKAKMPSTGDVWASSLRSDVSVNAADLGLTNDLFQEYQASAANQSDMYSQGNQNLMKQALAGKIEANTWENSEEASSTFISFIVPEDSGFELPSISEGLESLSIGLRDGLLEVSLSVGNSNIQAAKLAMFNLRASNSRLRHTYYSPIPDQFASIASQKLVALAKGIIK